MNNLKSWLFGLTLFSYTALFATPITVPTSLSPGDMYRLIFVTSTGLSGASTDISTHNAFVQGVANGQTELNALGATWTVIGSTDTVNARDNTGTTGSGTGIFIYNVNDEQLASSYDDLWDGLLDNPVGYDESANAVIGSAFTGTNNDGTTAVGNTLGSSSIARGAVASPNFWVNSSTLTQGIPLSRYAISSVLTVPPAVVPEPGTYLMLGSTLLIAAHLKKKKKA